MRRLRVVLVAALAIAAVAGVQVSLAVGDDGRGGGEGNGPNAGARGTQQRVNFVTVCDFSHRNRDDVIIFPGPARPVARSHVLRQHVDGCGLDPREPSRGRHDVRALGGHGGLLGADPAP